MAHRYQRAPGSRSRAGRQRRAERASIAVASRALFEWGQMFTDARLAAAVVDRLIFRAHILETGSESYRLRVSRTRKGAAREALITTIG